MTSIVPEAKAWESVIRVIDVPAGPGSPSLELVLDGEAERALAYLNPPTAAGPAHPQRESTANEPGSAKTSATS